MRMLPVANNLVLRPLQGGDAKELFRITELNRDYLARYLPWVNDLQSLDHAKAYIEFCEREWRAGSGAHFGIYYHSQLSGHISLMFIRPKHKAEVGYWIVENLSGRGITRRSVRAVMNYAFTELQLRRLLICSRPDNVASIAVARRLGFRYEGRERLGERHGQDFFDLEHYGLLAPGVQPLS